MNEEAVIELFKLVGAIKAGHFVGTSGIHLDRYVSKDAVSTRPLVLSQLAAAIARKVHKDEVEVVLAPAVGCIALGQWVAFHLSLHSERLVLSLYAERAGESFVLRRGFAKDIRGRRTLVLEDVVNTGNSIRQTMAVARAHGARVVAAATLWNRGGANLLEVGFPPNFIALTSRKLPSWTPEECRHFGPCSHGVEVDKEYGHYELYQKQQK